MRYNTANVHEFGHRDSEREHKERSRAYVGKRTTKSGGSQIRATHQGADVTKITDGKQRIEQSILGEASMVPRVFRGHNR